MGFDDRGHLRRLALAGGATSLGLVALTALGRRVLAEPRSTRAVLEDHLHCRKVGDLDGDLARNYAPDVVLLSAEGVHRGHAGVRHLAGILRSYVPKGSYHYRQILCQGKVGMLQWTGDGSDVDIHDGADSYVVRDGRIVAQTIHYSTRDDSGRRELSRRTPPDRR